ncbi:MAG: rhomboid family intramembrane serine protease [Planctomycetota bacterium]
MRRIGQTPNFATAERFCDYLETKSIRAKTDTEDDPESPHDIWIREERDVDPARDILNEFLQRPDDSKFDAAAEAATLRRQRDREVKTKLRQQNKAQQRLRGRGSFAGGSPTTGSIPVVITVIVLSTIASFATNFGNPKPSSEPGQLSSEQRIFTSLSCVDRIAYRATGDQFLSLKKGEIWRLITPMFLHGATFHLAFNMLALFTLGSVVERIHGSAFLAGLLLISQVGAMGLQMSIPELPLPPLLMESPIAIGASGAVFGVFGFVWIRPKIERDYPVEIPPMNVALMLGFLFVCMTPLISGIANGAHLGGLVIGVIVARFWPTR